MRNYNLTVNVGFTSRIIFIHIGYRNFHCRYSLPILAIICFKLYLNSSLRRIIQQAAAWQIYANAVICRQINHCSNNGVPAFRIRYRYQICAYRCFTFAVGYRLIVNSLNNLGFQNLTAFSARFVFAPLGGQSGLLVHHPFAGSMTSSVQIISLIAISAIFAGESCITHFFTSWSNCLAHIIVASGRFKDCVTSGADLRLGTGSRPFGWSMPQGRFSLQPVQAAAFTSIFRHSLAVANRIRNRFAVVPLMTGRLNIIGNITIATTLILTGVSSKAFFQTSRRCNLRLVIMPQRFSIIRFVTEIAILTGESGVSHFQTGGRGYFFFEIVPGCFIQNCSAFSADLRLQTVGIFSRRMPGGAYRFQSHFITILTAVFNHSVPVADRINHCFACVPLMAGGLGVICNIAVAATLTDKCSISSLGAGSGCNLRQIIMPQRFAVIRFVGITAALILAGNGCIAHIQTICGGYFFFETVS